MVVRMRHEPPRGGIDIAAQVAAPTAGAVAS
jgi:hypothetical protein